MSRVLGFLFFLLFLSGMAFVMLQGMQPIQANDGAPGYVNVDWRPVTLDGEVVPDSAIMLLRFERDGQLNGHGGCNGFFGSYATHDSDIEIGEIGATRMACPEPLMSLETHFFDVLKRARRLVVDGDRLLVRDVEDGEIAVMIANVATQP